MRASDPSQSRRPVAQRRGALLAAAVATMAAGLGVHYLLTGPAADFSADALYAALVFLVLAAIAPRSPSIRIAVIAFAACTAIELFQLTGVPADIASRFLPAALLLGSTFAPLDLLAYAAGAALPGALDAAVRRQFRARPSA